LSFLQPCHSPNLVILSAAKNLLSKAKDLLFGGYINHHASPNNLVILSAAKNLLLPLLLCQSSPQGIF